MKKRSTETFVSWKEAVGGSGGRASSNSSARKPLGIGLPKNQPRLSGEPLLLSPNLTSIVELNSKTR